MIHSNNGKLNRVLVTGAGGFLGGWVVESFLAAGIAVRAGVRRWNSAVRLARHAADVVHCDVLSAKQLAKAMEDCDAVVHCAVGNEQVTVSGTSNLLAVARERRVRRIVHISSVAVYGKASGHIDEQYPRHSRGNYYAHCKLEAEKVCERYIADGVPVVVLRPSIIYGPFSEAWTVSFAKRLMSGRWGTFGSSGEGTCNLVYVTDVVQAIHHALLSEHATGKFFNVNGADLITWNEYFRRFNAELGRSPLPQINALPIAMKARALAPVRTMAKFALARFNKAIMSLHARSSLAAKYMNLTESNLKLTPTREQLKLYGLRAEYDIAKARAALNYQPEVDSHQGLQFSVAWLRQQGLVE